MVTLSDCNGNASADVLLAEEKTSSCDKEKRSWIDAVAYERVDQSKVPAESNIIGSLVVNKKKGDGTRKVRIVSWGDHDDEIDVVCGDAPSLNLDLMPTFISVAVERGWKLGKINVKPAYLQTKGYNRDVYCSTQR